MSSNIWLILFAIVCIGIVTIVLCKEIKYAFATKRAKEDVIGENVTICMKFADGVYTGFCTDFTEYMCVSNELLETGDIRKIKQIKNGICVL